jgi:hypothetical protein
MNVNAAGTAELVASYIAALGTISAVVLALFLQVFLVGKQRPQLQVTLSDDFDDEDIVLLEFDHSFEYYLRVKIWAQPKRRSANRVRGLLLMATRPEQAEDTLTRKVSDGAFKWTGPVGQKTSTSLRAHGAV